MMNMNKCQCRLMEILERETNYIFSCLKLEAPFETPEGSMLAVTFGVLTFKIG